ncbi:MAG: formimidoylglutamase [Phycisphaerales bacterium]
MSTTVRPIAAGLVPPTWPDSIPAARFAAAIEHRSPTGCDVALIGLPDDLGVRLNSGRPGASEGPREFRAALSRYGVADPPDITWPKVFDAGDIEPDKGTDADALARTHDKVTAVVTEILNLGLFPIAIGGGHDLTFPFVRAVAQKHGTLDGVYFDAHLDVRPEPGSGMPFRKLIEDGRARRLQVFGLNRVVTTEAHARWFTDNDGVIHTPESRPRSPEDFPVWPCFVSLDLDVIDSAHAPGVSAINPAGWSAADAQAAAVAAGRTPSVRCFDLMELSPPHDHDGRTARLAAHLFLSFLHGFAQRPR